MDWLWNAAGKMKDHLRDGDEGFASHKQIDEQDAAYLYHCSSLI